MRMEANKVPFRDASPPRHAVTFSQGDESMGLDAFSHWRELRGVLPLAPNSQVPEQSPRSRRTLGFSSHFPPKCHTLYHKCSSMIAVARPITQVVFVAGETNGGDGVFDIRFFATNYGYGTARIRGHGTTMPICRDSVHCRPERGPGVTFRNICAPDMMIRPGSVPRADGRLPTGFMQLSSLPRPTNPCSEKDRIATRGRSHRRFEKTRRSEYQYQHHATCYATHSPRLCSSQLDTGPFGAIKLSHVCIARVCACQRDPRRPDLREWAYASPYIAASSN